MPLDRDALIDEYNHKVLPEAIEEDQRLIAALKKVASDPPPKLTKRKPPKPKCRSAAAIAWISRANCIS